MMNNVHAVRIGLVCMFSFHGTCMCHACLCLCMHAVWLPGHGMFSPGHWGPGGGGGHGGPGPNPSYMGPPANDYNSFGVSTT